MGQPVLDKLPVPRRFDYIRENYGQATDNSEFKTAG